MWLPAEEPVDLEMVFETQVEPRKKELKILAWSDLKLPGTGPGCLDG